MDIVRVRSVEIIRHIHEHLVFVDPSNKEPFVEHLTELMTQYSDSVLVLAAIDDGIVKGFLIAQNPGQHYNYVFISQVWSCPGNTWTVANRFLDWAIHWALALGKTMIRGETQRSTEGFFRRFAFLPLSTNVGLSLEKFKIPSYEEPSDG